MSAWTCFQISLCILIPFSAAVHIIAVRRCLVCVHGAAAVQVVPGPIDELPSGEHVTVQVEIIPCVIDFFPGIRGVTPIIISVPPSILVLDPGTVTIV